MFFTIILVVVLFSILIILHEFGHFIVARRNGVQVDEFGIGFPPRLFGIQKGKTLYSINALPLGGFVRLKGESGESVAKDSFSAQRAWVKSKILLAGVGMNLLIAYVIITGLLATGVPPIFPGNLPNFGAIRPTSSSQHLLIVGVEKSSVAEISGLKVGNRILRIGSEVPTSPADLRNILLARKGKVTKIEILDGKTRRDVSAQLPSKASDKGLLGVATIVEGLQRYPWWAAPVAAVLLMFEMILATFAAFGGLVVGLFAHAKVTEGVTGPIGVTVLFGSVFKYGAAYVLALLASVSLSLAVVNAFPLPALDGGRLLVVVLQKLGIRVSPGLETATHAVGFVALIILMIIISAADIARLR